MIPWTICLILPLDLLMMTVLATKINLASSDHYLITYKLLDQIGFVVFKALQVLICRKCGHCYISKDTIEHAHSCQNVSQRSIGIEEFQVLVLKLIHLEASSIHHPSP